MTTTEIILLTATLIVLFSTLWQSPRWLNYAPFGLVVLLMVQFGVNGFSANLLAVVLVIAALCWVTVTRLMRSKQSHEAARSKWQWLLAILGRGLGIFALYLAVITTLYHSLPPADLRQLSWTKAFDAAHAKISKEYAFGAWKQVNWDALYATYAPKIALAESRQDAQAYYAALLGYTSSIPDGHVWLKGDDHGAREAAIGGGCGLTILGVADGRVLAVSISPGGPASQAGIQWGAEIVSWNGLPIQTALQQTQVIWPKRRGAPATVEGLLIERYRLLVRSPVGTKIKVAYRNPGTAQIREAALVSVLDGETSGDGNVDAPIPPVEKGIILPSGYGYIKINHENGENSDDPQGIIQSAIELFVAQNVPGVILDVRGNHGGSDEWVPQFVGHFFKERSLYENVTIYLQPSNTFIDRPPQLWIEPLKPYYSRPVIVLIDNATFSSGEGIPMAISRLPQGNVMGFYGTYGSFGMTGGSIWLPGDLTLYFPDGQSLDRDGTIQLDSNGAMQGGVAPTIRVPMTEDVAKALFVEKEDVLLNEAIKYFGNH